MERKLLDLFRDKIIFKHYSVKTEKAECEKKCYKNKLTSCSFKKIDITLQLF
jgi:hypothetical protein